MQTPQLQKSETLDLIGPMVFSLRYTYNLTL